MKLSQKTVELSEDYIYAYAKEFVKGYYEGLAGLRYLINHVSVGTRHCVRLWVYAVPCLFCYA